MKLFTIRKRPVITLIAGASLLALASCQSVKSPQFSASHDNFPTGVAPFDEYQAQVKQWIEAERYFVGENPAEEIAMNMPYECGISNSDTGVLLVHGLGDSPYFFHDEANALCKNGVRVRTILLPGHGTKPGDMLRVSYQQWQDETDFQLASFEKEVNTLYAGGFSTGANLVTVNAFDNDAIAGLLLFSPAYKARFFVSKLTPYVDSLFVWPNIEKEDNPSRYNSTAMPGFAAYQESVNALQARFKEQQLDVPVLMIVAEKDSVVDTHTVATQFHTKFTSSRKCLLWQGQQMPMLEGQAAVETSNLVLQAMQLPDKSISAASHMSVLFSESNPLYGTASDFRICDNGQSSEKEQRCIAGEEVWYGPWGYTDENHVYARLTYNPYFDELIENVLALTQEEKANHYCL